MILPKLKIGLDYHGVIDDNPAYFAEFTAVARFRGHQIYIISGAPKVLLSRQLKQNNISYDFIFSILDYCLALGQITQNSDGLKIVDDAWNKAKAEFCRLNHIDLHIDDTPVYCDYFTTVCCLYDKSEHLCRAEPSLILNFNPSPLKILSQIEQFFIQFL